MFQKELTVKSKVSDNRAACVCCQSFTEEYIGCFTDLHRRWNWVFSIFNTLIKEFYISFLHSLPTQITQCSIQLSKNISQNIVHVYENFSQPHWYHDYYYKKSQKLLRSSTEIHPLYVEITLLMVCIKERKCNVIKWNL